MGLISDGGGGGRDKDGGALINLGPLGARQPWEKMFCLQFVRSVIQLLSAVCVSVSLILCGVMTAGCGPGLTGQTDSADMELPPCWGEVADHDGVQSRPKKGPDPTSHA